MEENCVVSLGFEQLLAGGVPSVSARSVCNGILGGFLEERGDGGSVVSTVCEALVEGLGVFSNFLGC